jgi:5-deoxy-glucuronate isomerase
VSLHQPPGLHQPPSLHRPRGSLTGRAGEDVFLTPEAADWSYAGLRVLTVPPGAAVSVATGESEVLVLPLSGSLYVSVAAAEGGDEEARYHLQGRDSVFTAATDFAYAGRDSVLGLVSERGAEVALPEARCFRRLPPAYGPVEGVPAELRGAGQASRLVRNIATPGGWDHADKLLCCELVTPPGNWSSHPPHKHDVTAPCEVVNEEIYYYRIAGPDQVTPSAKGFGLHRTYTGPEHAAAGLAPLDASIEVRDGDVVLVPYGYHGPCAAAPGYPMYYLNVLAGPDEHRSMAFCDDPAHGWIRQSWTGQAPDPRLHPGVRTPGPRRSP